MLTGRALEDGLCQLCREEATALAADQTTATGAVVDRTCSSRDGNLPCGRTPLPNRSVRARHRIQELAGAVA